MHLSSLTLLDKRETLLRPGTNLHLYKDRYVKGFLLMSNYVFSDVKYGICTAARHYTEEHRKHSFWESSRCIAEKGPRPANGQDAICQLQNCTTALIAGHNSVQLFCTEVPVSSADNMRIFPKSTEALANSMLSCITTIKNKQTQDCC